MITIKMFTILTFILSFSSMNGIQLLVTILLIWMKFESYLYCNITLETYILIDYKISYLLGLLSFMFMIHYVQLFNNNNNNILSMIIFICHNILYIIDFDMNIIT